VSERGGPREQQATTKSAELRAFRAERVKPRLRREVRERIKAGLHGPRRPPSVRPVGDFFAPEHWLSAVNVDARLERSRVSCGREDGCNSGLSIGWLERVRPGLAL
jgi:hypothetical protein